MTCYEMSQQIEEYMVYCCSKQLSRKTMASYEQSLRLFEKWYRDTMKIDDVALVTESVIRRYINDLQVRGKYTVCSDDESMGKNYPMRRRDYRQAVSVTTINNYIRNLRAFFNWLEQESVLRKNPMKRIKQLRNSRQPKEYMANEDFKKLTGVLDKSYFSEHRDYVIIVLMLDSGMRLGECLRLTADDIHLAKRRAVLRAKATKGRKGRTVYFSARTERILRRWIQFAEILLENFH